MKKKIFIFGHTGYIGSYLLKCLINEEFETHGRKIPRPNNTDLYNFYYQFISDFLDQNKNMLCIINCGGSINCQTEQDFFFNSNFDVIFQKILDERKINTKYLSLNSTKIFSNALDNYTLSKKKLDQNLIKNDMFYTLYIDLVFDDDSPHFKTIKKKIQDIKINIIPVFKPGKNFYPINLDSLGDTIKKIVNGNYKIRKFIIIGDKKMNFCNLIEYVNETSNLNKKILYIPSKIINKFPNFIKKILLKSKTFQQYDNDDWLRRINYDEFLIRKSNNEF
tara:strand:+ start:901 stop:1734 length:834 start_codon:yes stop_codon:yes gene_type:complete